MSSISSNDNPLQPNDNGEVDYFEYFRGVQLFNCRADLIQWARDTAESHGIKLIIGHTFCDRVYVTCDRFGKKQVKRKNRGVESTKCTGTKKCYCGFQLKGALQAEDKWELSIVYGKHNHPPASKHGLYKQLSKKQYEVTEMLTRSHVKPKKILNHLRREYPNITTSLKYIYNARLKIKIKLMGGKTVIQHLMQCINESKYIQRHRADSVTNEVIDLLFVDPRIPDMLKLFPYVLLMDSTYKTNRYKMPLLEIVGVTPVGKNFTVAIAFMQHENEEHYNWVLSQVKSIFYGCSEPGVIVTDRELGLIKAIEHVFPRSYHLLCIFHINRNVGLHATRHMGNKKNLGVAFAQGPWKKLVMSLSEEEFTTNYANMLIEYEAHYDLMKYLQDTWLMYKERFVRAWTDKVFHLGNTSTNRVESAHSAFKDWIESSTSAFDTIWTEHVSNMDCQINEINSEFEKSKRIRLNIASYPIFRNLEYGVVSHNALRKLDKERLRDASTCTCFLRKTHGLPCAHEIAVKISSGDVIHFEEVHVFWRTLSFDVDPNLLAVVPDHRAELVKRLNELFIEMSTRSDVEFRDIVAMIFSKLHPAETELIETAAQRPRGRPKKNSTRRDPSAWEYPISKKSSRGRNRGRGSSFNKSNHDQRSTSTVDCDPIHQVPPCFFRYIHYALVPDVRSWVDVRGDGNCGFRCVAHAVKGHQNHWLQVRHDLFHHMRGHMDLYTDFFGSRDYLGRVMQTLCHWDDIPAPPERWMSLFDLATVIATCYNAMVLELGNPQNQTHLPLFSSNGAMQLEISILLVRDRSHFVYLDMSPNCPLPPITTMWRRYRNDNVVHLESKIQARRGNWDLLINRV